MSLQSIVKARWQLILGAAGVIAFLTSVNALGGFIALLGFGMLLVAVLYGLTARPAIITMAVAAVLDLISLAQPWLAIDPLPLGRGLQSCTRYCAFVRGGFQSGSAAPWIGTGTCLLLLLTLFYTTQSPARPEALQVLEVAIMSVLSALVMVVMIWQLLDFERDYSWWIQHGQAQSPSMTGAAFFGPLGAIVALGASASLWLRRHGARRVGSSSVRQPDRLKY